MSILVWSREDAIELWLALELQSWDDSDEKAHPTVNRGTHFAPNNQKVLQAVPGTFLVEE